MLGRFERNHEMTGTDPHPPRARKRCGAEDLAEREGFEPSNPFGSPVFKTGAFVHSATAPLGIVDGRAESVAIPIAERGFVQASLIVIALRTELAMKHRPWARW